MRRSALPAAVVLTAAAAASIIACASILGIEDGILDKGDEGGIQICSVDSGVQVDSSQLFVAHDFGDDSAGCTAQTPCKTIQAAINATIGHPEFHLIYVSSVTERSDAGTPVAYSESLNLPAGVEIQGGWFARGRNPSVQWQQVCNATDETQTANIEGLDNTTIHAENLNGSAILTKLVIKTRPPAPGESVYGIFGNPTAQLTLNNVLVDIGPGGGGVPGAKGDDGSEGNGTCTVGGSGSDGNPGDAGTSAPPTVFNATGAVSANGTSGADGDPGSNGQIGADGGCVACISCSATDCQGSLDPSCGIIGQAGCAGTGGKGGSAGQSGGSSIAIFAWGGMVIINGGVIHAGNGGNGGAGGAGGTGGTGSPGTMGGDGPTCATSCKTFLGGCTGVNTSSMGAAGGNGTGGGAGGNGGMGASGAGGDSIAIVSGLDASVLTDGGDPVDIAAGAAGDPDGIKAARYP